MMTTAVLGGVYAGDAAAQTDVGVFLPAQPDRLLPSFAQNTIIFATNSGAAPAHDVRVTVTPLSGAHIGGINPGFNGPLTSSIVQGIGMCTAKELAAHSSAAFDVRFETPDRDDGGTVGMQIDVTSSDEDPNPANNHATSTIALVRQFAVTTTADDGAGSLRQAIRDADDACAAFPCRIVFRMPAPVPRGAWVHDSSRVAAAAGERHRGHRRDDAGRRRCAAHRDPRRPPVLGRRNRHRLRLRSADPLPPTRSPSPHRQSHCRASRGCADSG